MGPIQSGETKREFESRGLIEDNDGRSPAIHKIVFQDSGVQQINFNKFKLFRSEPKLSVEIR